MKLTAALLFTWISATPAFAAAPAYPGTIDRVTKISCTTKVSFFPMAPPFGGSVDKALDTITMDLPTAQENKTFKVKVNDGQFLQLQIGPSSQYGEGKDATDISYSVFALLYQVNADGSVSTLGEDSAGFEPYNDIYFQNYKFQTKDLAMRNRGITDVVLNAKKFPGTQSEIDALFSKAVQDDKIQLGEWTSVTAECTFKY